MKPDKPQGGPLDGRTPKYLVSKADGSPVDPEARYLTLRIDNKAPGSPEHDALAAYLAGLDAQGGAPLARHLREFFGVNL